MYIFFNIPHTNKAADLNLFSLCRSWRHVTFVNLGMNLIAEGNHAPGFYFAITILNIVLIEINIYDSRHIEDRYE